MSTNSKQTAAARWILLSAHATVFVSSFCVMVIELVAGRIISTHLGSSLYTWTSVIGVVLGGLALGNWIGGILADRHSPQKTLSLLFVGSAVTCVTVVILNNIVGSWSALWDLSWPVRVATHVALVFLLPSAFLGTIGPVVGKMALEVGTGTGRTLGSVYAWGVIGSLCGTFTTGYLLVSLLGTDAIIWCVAVVLVVCGLLHAPKSIQAWGWASAVILACLLANVAGTWAHTLGEGLGLRDAVDPRVVYSDESRYSHIEVRRLSDDPPVLGLYLDKLLHSRLTAGDPLRAQYGYVHVFADLVRLRAARDRPLRTLTIGGGGYVFPQWIEKNWPDATVEVIEIDPAVTRAARNAFGLDRDSRIIVHHTDGRAWVNRRVERLTRGEHVERYDLIFIDAVNDYAVPFQLTTVEFFDKIQRLLTPDGVVAMNFIDLLSSGRMAGALSATAQESFEHVELVSESPIDRLGAESRMTLVLVASKQALSKESISRPIVTPDRLADFQRRANHRVLEDSHAPIEQLIAPVVRVAAREIGASEALRRALGRAERGDQQGFLEDCREAVRLDPEFSEGHYNLGVALYATGALDEAVGHWERAVALKPEYAEARFNLGAERFRRGDLEKAAVHLRAAVRARPEMVDAHRALGVVEETRGRLEIAAGHYSEALRLNPRNGETRAHLERVRAALGS